MFIFTSIYIFIIPHKFQVSYDNVEPFEPYCKNNYRIRFDNELKAFCNYGSMRSKNEKGISGGYFDLYMEGGHITIDRGISKEETNTKRIETQAFKKVNMNHLGSIYKSKKKRKQEIFRKFENDLICITNPSSFSKDNPIYKKEGMKKNKKKTPMRNGCREESKEYINNSTKYDHFLRFEMNPSTKHQSSFYDYEQFKEFKTNSVTNGSSVEKHMYIYVTIFCTIMTIVIYSNVIKFYDSCKCAMCMNYVIIRKIGNGGFGKVYIAYKKRKMKRRKRRRTTRISSCNRISHQTQEEKEKSIQDENMCIERETKKICMEGNRCEKLCFERKKEDTKEHNNKVPMKNEEEKFDRTIEQKQEEPITNYVMEHLQLIKDKMKYMYALQNSKITYKRKVDPSSKKLYAVKKININDVNELNYYQREASVLNKIKNKYIVKYTTHCVHKVRKLFRKSQIQYVIIFEYCCNRDLFDYINKNYEHINEYMIFRWLIQITKGLHYLHSENIIHRDIKTPNIFLDQHLNARIGDLGLSRHYRIKKKKKEKNAPDYFMRCSKNKIYTHEKNDKIDSKNKKNIYSSDTLSICGTSAYLAPEMNNSYYDENIDKWALGLALVEMCSGVNIDTMLKSKIKKSGKKEEEDNEKELEKFYLEDIYSYIPNFISPIFVNIIKKLLIINANERISLKEIINKEHEVKKILSKVPFYVYLYDSKEERIKPNVYRRTTFKVALHTNNWILRKRKRTSDKAIGVKRRHKFKLVNLKIFSYENVLIKNIQKIKTKLFISFLKTFDKRYIHRFKIQEKKNNVYKLKNTNIAKELFSM